MRNKTLLFFTPAPITDSDLRLVLFTRPYDPARYRAGIDSDFDVVGRHTEAQSTPLAATVWFVAGYLLVWVAFAVLATLVQWTLERTALLDSAMASTSNILGGLVFMAAGSYQWTRLKDVCDVLIGLSRSNSSAESIICMVRLTESISTSSWNNKERHPSPLHISMLAGYCARRTAWCPRASQSHGDVLGPRRLHGPMRRHPYRGRACEENADVDQ